MIIRIRARSIVALSLLAASAGVIALGPLDPPIGPVSPTYKTLTEVQPRTPINATNTPGDADSLFKIIQPGSYYLTASITGVVGKHGIEIAASGVSLDLNGFDLVGVPAMGAFDAVSVSVNSLSNISVSNGSARAWGDAGVDLGFLTIGARVLNVAASGNAGNGINAGISATVTGCTASSNTLSGIRVNNGSSISACTASSNGTSGVFTNNACVLANVSTYFNAVGITTGSSCSLSACTAFTNSGNGIQLGEGGTATACSTGSNAANGINTANACTVADSTCTFNNLDGIRCVSVCTLRNNTCSFNGAGQAGNGAGIHATGERNRIDSNSCTNADRGIEVGATHNIIIRNTCAGNSTNWDIAPDNVILVIANGPSLRITGDSGGAGYATTDPNANFTH